MSVWIALERAGTPTMPDISPMALTSFVPATMLITRLFIADNGDGTFERRLMVGKNPDYGTKYRSLPDVVVAEQYRNPNLGKLLGYLMGRVPAESMAQDAVEMSGAISFGAAD